MIPLSDPRVAAVPVHETYDPLVTLGRAFGPARARVRSRLAARLHTAQVALPVGTVLSVVEGHCSTQPHASGGAVDVTLVDLRGRDLDMAVPQRRALLARTLTGAGLVGDPERWWHWSFGDRHWALVTGAPAALYGPVPDLDSAVRDAA